MNPGRRHAVAFLIAGLAACQSPAPQPDTAALIVDPDAASRAELPHAVAGMLGLSTVVLADDALTTTSSLSIERSTAALRIEGRAQDRPEIFNLVLRKGACVLVRARDGQHAVLVRTRCRALPP